MSDVSSMTADCLLVPHPDAVEHTKYVNETLQKVAPRFTIENNYF